MSFRNSPWSGRLKEGYFLIADKLTFNGGQNPYISMEEQKYLAIELTKDGIFDKLREAEARGIICHVEDLKGNRLS